MEKSINTEKLLGLKKLHENTTKLSVTFPVLEQVLNVT
jgi:hypothetical protein